MNKFGLILLLIASFSTFTSQEIPEDDIYAAVVALFKGMAETDEAARAGVLVKQKDKILEFVHAIIDEIESGVDTGTALQNALLKLMGVDGLVSECNVLAIPSIITKVTSKDGLVDIFQTCIDNIDEIYSYEEDIKAAFDEKDYIF